MKTKEELNALRNEVEVLNKKLAELTSEELEQVTGGQDEDIFPHDCDKCHCVFMCTSSEFWKHYESCTGRGKS